MVKLKRRIKRTVLITVVFAVLIVVFAVIRSFANMFTPFSLSGGTAKEKLYTDAAFVSNCIRTDGDIYGTYRDDKVSAAKSLYDLTGIQLWFISCDRRNDPAITNESELKDEIARCIDRCIENMDNVIAVCDGRGYDELDGITGDTIHYGPSVYDYYVYGDDVINYLTAEDIKTINYLTSNRYSLFDNYDTRNYDMWAAVGQFIRTGDATLNMNGDKVSILRTVDSILNSLIVLCLILTSVFSVKAVWLILKVVNYKDNDTDDIVRILEADVNPIDTDTEKLIDKYSGDKYD